MTYPTEPPRSSGMPPWARWTLIGCAGCLTLVALGIVGCGALGYFLVGRNMKMIDMSDKPDLPLTATAGQLLPPRVDSFVRQSVTRIASPGTSAASGWKAQYVSGSQQVEMTVRPTAAARQAPAEPSPLGGRLPQSRNPNVGIHISLKARSLDMVMWTKSNWTFMVLSHTMSAEAFARAYQPGRSTPSHSPKAGSLR